MSFKEPTLSSDCNSRSGSEVVLLNEHAGVTHCGSAKKREARCVRPIEVEVYRTDQADRGHREHGQHGMSSWRIGRYYLKQARNSTRYQDEVVDLGEQR